MTEKRGELPRTSATGGELFESDSLGDAHRRWDEQKARRTKDKLTRGQPLTRERLKAAGLDKLPDLPAGPKPEPAPTKAYKPPTVRDYINHRQD